VRLIGFKLLTKRKRQTIVSLLGIAIGITAFIVMSAMMRGFQKYIIAQAIDVNAHVTLKTEQKEDKYRILRLAYGEGVIAEVLGSKPKDIKDKIVGYKFIIEKYQVKEGVIGVAPHLTGQAILRYGTKDKPVSILGIDPELERRASVIDRFMVYGRLDQLLIERNTIVLGKMLAEDLGIHEIGKKVNLIAPNGTIHVLKVVDLFDSGIVAYDESRVYIDLRTLQAILEKPNEVNELIFKIKDVDKAEALARAISKETGYYAESWQIAFRNFLQLFRMQNLITNIIVFAILVVSAFGIFNIMMMTVLEKKRDIAILKAMGYESVEIIKIFVFQGVVIGVVGGVLGCILGYLCREWLGTLRFEFTGLIKSEGFILDKNPMFFLYGFIYANLFSFLASFYPSYKASKLYPVDIFRSGG
jgi:lipoprotein-releasing system permease protein